MGCTPSSQSSDQTGFAYGCGHSSSANEMARTQDRFDPTAQANRSSIEMNGTHTGVLPNNRVAKDSLVSTCLLFGDDSLE